MEQRCSTAAAPISWGSESAEWSKPVRLMLAATIGLLWFAAGTPVLAQKTRFSIADSLIAYCDIGGQRLAYRSIGSGPPVMLLTRFRATMEDWDPAFLEALASERRVIILDYLGVGRSSGEVPTTIKGKADAIMACARALGLSQVDLVGWSMGGPIVTVAAIEHPDRVRRFVAIGSTPPGQPLKSDVPTTTEFRRRAVKPQWDFDDFVFLFFRDNPNGREAARASFDRLSAVAPGHVEEVPQTLFSRQGAAIRDYDADPSGYLARFATITQPALIITGDYDAAFPTTIGVEYQRRLSDSRLAVLPDAGHAPHGQYPEIVARYILDFLR